MTIYQNNIAAAFEVRLVSGLSARMGDLNC